MGQALPKNVLVIDDHPIVREGITQLLAQQRDLRSCGSAIDAASARRATVRLERHGERSMLAIEDDGVGIQLPPEEIAGLGLRSMRHRAAMIGGTLEVTSPVGDGVEAGTIVRCWWTG